MLSRMHEKLGTAGFILAIVALIAALGGGAYAAQAKLNSTQKKEVKKIAQTEAKKFATAGPQGPAGPKGDTGTAGAPGAAGTDGISPTGTAFAGNEKGCTEGGVEIKGANTTVVCNGKKGNNGAPGAEGDPWTAGGTLPVGSTQTGSWTTPRAPNATANQPSLFVAPITFFLPLAAPLAYNEESANSKVHVIWPNGKEIEEKAGEGPVGEVTPPHCPGTVENPKADSGHLCVYVAEMSEAFFTPFNSNILRADKGGSEKGAGKTGAILTLPNASATAGARIAYGTFAVTG